MTREIKKEYNPTTVKVKDLTIGDTFEHFNNIYMVVASLGNEDTSIISLASGKICPMHDDTDVIPIYINITYGEDKNLG